MLTCLLLPFVSLELEHEPLVQSPFRLMQEWEQPVEVIPAPAAGMAETVRPETGHWVLACDMDGGLSVGMYFCFAYNGLQAISVCSSG